MNRRGKKVLISGKGGKVRQGTKEPINPEAIEHNIDVILTFAASTSPKMRVYYTVFAGGTMRGCAAHFNAHCLG